MQKFMIIDGSSIFYRAFYAMPPLTAPDGEPTGAVVGFANIILKLLRENNPDYAAVAMDTSRKTFRTEIFSDYKGTRDKMPDELGAQIPLYEKFCDVLGLKKISAENFEADDIIGTLAAQSAENFSVEIVTGDRDSLQLINSSTKVLLTKNTKVEVWDEKKFFDEYGFEPKKLVDFKGLSGDNSDNIPGVRGIGPKTATKLLQEFGDVENILAHVEEIQSKKIRESLKNSADVALMSKKLAKIICDVPNVIFDAEDFKITPNLNLADDFCNKYALNVAKKKIHELFDTTENLFGNFAVEENFKFLEVPEITPTADMEKIFSAKSLAVVDNIVKIFGG